MWFPNDRDDLPEIRAFAEDTNMEGILLYGAGELYSRYFPEVSDGSGYAPAPYPLQVVIGPDGVIELISHEYDASALHAALDAALAE